MPPCHQSPHDGTYGVARTSQACTWDPHLAQLLTHDAPMLSASADMGTPCVTMQSQPFKLTDGHRDISSAADLAAARPGDTLLVVPLQKGGALKLPVKVRKNMCTRLKTW